VNCHGATFPRRHVIIHRTGSADRSTGCEDTADRARAQIKLDQEDHGQSVRHVASDAAYPCHRSCWVGARVRIRRARSIDRSAVPGRKLSRSLAVTRRFDPERDARRSLVGGFAKLGWRSKTSVYLRWRRHRATRRARGAVRPPLGRGR
jgi:hypothetical protein